MDYFDLQTHTGNVVASTSPSQMVIYQYNQNIATTTYQFMFPHVEPVTTSAIVWDMSQAIFGVVVFLGGIYYGYKWIKKLYAF